MRNGTGCIAWGSLGGVACCAAGTAQQGLLVTACIARAVQYYDSVQQRLHLHGSKHHLDAGWMRCPLNGCTTRLACMHGPTILWRMHASQHTLR